MCLCSLCLRDSEMGETALFFLLKSSQQNCRETNPSDPSSAGCLCTNRPPFSYEQTPRPLPAVRSQPHSVGGKEQPRETCRTEKGMKADQWHPYLHAPNIISKDI